MSRAENAPMSHFLPEARYRDAAISRSSGGNSGVLTFTPMPMTTQKPPGVVQPSVKMPQSLRPPRSTSFGHLMDTSSSGQASRQRHSATAAQEVRLTVFSGGQSGRQSIDRYSPPSGERKLRPSRPRPAVCSLAQSTVPSGAPCAASFLRALLVESMLRAYSTGAARSASSRVKP